MISPLQIYSDMIKTNIKFNDVYQLQRFYSVEWNEKAIMNDEHTWLKNEAVVAYLNILN